MDDIKLTKVDVLDLKSGCQNVIDAIGKNDENLVASCATCESFPLKYSMRYPK